MEPSDTNHPSHYTSHPSGVECIEITEHMNFCLGNAIKYIWRAGLKAADPTKDLKKARWYIDREIERLTVAQSGEREPYEVVARYDMEKRIDIDTDAPGRVGPRYQS